MVTAEEAAAQVDLELVVNQYLLVLIVLRLGLEDPEAMDPQQEADPIQYFL